MKIHPFALFSLSNCLVILLVLSLDHVTAIPTQINNIGTDVFHQILEFLPLKDALNTCQVNKQFNKECMSPSVQRLNHLLAKGSWYYKDRISNNIQELMKWANEGVSFTPSQQLWMLEAILSNSFHWLKKLQSMIQWKSVAEQKTRQWIKIVTSKFELTTAMYNVCIRIIQNQKYAKTHELAAELMIFMYQKGVPLPENVHSEMLVDTETLLQQLAINIKKTDMFRRNALTKAAKNGDFEMVQLLLESGVNANKGDVFGETALILASESGHLDIVKELLKQPGIKVNVVDKFDSTALRLASYHGHSPIVNQLLKHPGIDVNKANDNGGDTALISASENGFLEIVKELLKQPELDINKADIIGMNALIWASRKGSLQIVQLLLKHPGIHVNKADNTGMTALMWALMNKHTQISNTIMQYSPMNDDSFPLHKAAKSGNFQNVQKLLKHCGMNVNMADNNGNTALIWASRNGHFEIVELLLQQPAIHVNKADNEGWTALNWASLKAPIQIVEKLLQHPDIDVNKADNNGYTALMLASANHRLEIVELLLQQPGIIVNKATNSGYTALNWASVEEIKNKLQQFKKWYQF